MSPTASWKSTVASRHFWLLLGIVFLGRMAWWAYWGTLLEIDSLGYLELQTTLYHPPLYSVFNWVLLQVGRSVDAIVVGQSLLYSLAAAVVIVQGVRHPRWRVGLAIALAMEPCSGKLACTVMAETLFLSLVLLAFAMAPLLLAPGRREWWFAAGWIGLHLGLAYMTRYAAPVFVVAVVAWMWTAKLPWWRVAVVAVVAVLAFQLELLPLRLYYQSRFGTLQTNAFSGLSLWNSTAYLYPSSTLRDHPNTEFENYLQGWPDETFAISETWHTNQMFHDSLPFQRYVTTHSLGTADILDLARSAGETGRNLLLGAPWRHCNTFILPNVARPFSIQDTIHSDLLLSQVDAPMRWHFRDVHIYRPVYAWVIVGMLLFATVLQVRYRRQVPPLAGLLVVATWLYLAGVACLAVFFLRFVYILAPLLVLAIGMQLAALKNRAVQQAVE